VTESYRRVGGEWTSEHFLGSAADFHARLLPERVEPTLWWFEVQRPTVVLGSSQPSTHLDAQACARAGVEVVRRRSGGGAVWLEPGECTWVDVIVPVGHRFWTADVSSSAWWLGETWRDALHAMAADTMAADTTPAASVHRGPMVHTSWSSRVCFAGVGGGEVVIADEQSLNGWAKLVGVSQRRTRTAARLQCVVYRRWSPQRLVDVLAAPLPGDVDDLARVTATVEASPSEVRHAFEAVLSQR